ncbi:MAG: Hsp20/alpha crystallin family protein [Acidobacteriota bacterium]
MNKLFESVLTGPAPLEADGEGISYWRPVARVADTADELRIECEVAGVPLPGIDVRIDGGMLVVTGERNRPDETAAWTFHRLERPHGKFLRRFELPGGLDLEAVKATLEAGVLLVSLPKKPEARARSIRIERGATRDH